MRRYLEKDIQAAYTATEKDCLIALSFLNILYHLDVIAAKHIYSEARYRFFQTRYLAHRDDLSHRQ